jgi:hypothetical protein
MSTSALCDVVARLTTEPALVAELDADPDAFGRQHRLTVDEVATLRARRRPGWPQAARCDCGSGCLGPGWASAARSGRWRRTSTWT